VATETAEHAGGRFPPFDQIATTGVSQVFWLIVTFAILYIAVAYVFLPKIRKAIENRDDAIKRDVAKAAALSAKADESVKQFEARSRRPRQCARHGVEGQG
jgi:F-type H+-transporting ATPase subunit b